MSADPPLLLYAEGQLDRLALPALAVVGSRNPTAQGADNARAFARCLAQAGYATDPDYANKLIALMNRHQLQSLDGAVP